MRRLLREKCSSVGWFRVILETVGVAGGAGDRASVEFELVADVARVLGIADAAGIGIRDQGVEGQWGDGRAVVGVEVHVLVEAVGVEKM